MTFEELVKRITPKLKKIAYKLNSRYTVLDHDDLYQEALAHLWVDYKHGVLQNKTDSYILQGCFFYLKNYLRGVEDNTFFLSLDYPVGEEETTLGEMVGEYDDSGYKRADFQQLLESFALTNRERHILELYAKGLTMREVGEQLGVSHVAVLKIIEKIKVKVKRMPLKIKVLQR